MPQTHPFHARGGDLHIAPSSGKFRRQEDTKRRQEVGRGRCMSDKVQATQAKQIVASKNS